MLEFILNNSAFFIFLLGLSIFLYIKREKIEINGPFPIFYIMMYKTSLGLEKMKAWSEKMPKLFLNLSYLSIFIGIVGGILIFLFMLWQLGFILENELSTGGGLVLPLQTENGLDSAIPVFYVPFWYWIIALFILASVHEFAHGVIAERFRIRIKSSGFAFLGIFAPLIPAAFVEPDEKEMKKKPWWQQVAVLGAGSTSNFLFAILFFILWLFVAIPIFSNTMEVEGIYFNGVLEDSQLHAYNISSGKILSLNGEYEKTEILNGITKLEVNQTVNLSIQDNFGEVNYYIINTYQNPIYSERGMIGINQINFQYANKDPFAFLGNSPLHFERVLFYVWFLNLAIGMINLLPLWITDGGQILRVVSLRFIKKRETAFKIVNSVSLISLLLIIFTIWPSTLRGIISFFGF